MTFSPAVLSEAWTGWSVICVAFAPWKLFPKCGKCQRSRGDLRLHPRWQCCQYCPERDKQGPLVPKIGTQMIKMILRDHTSYLSPRSPIYRWRKIGHVEKFQISIHNRCGEIRNFARFGGISKFYTWQMWRNLKFILFLVVKSVLWQFTLFFA